MEGNQHELIVLSLDALVERTKEEPTLWEKYKHILEFTANYYASGLDGITATKLVTELGAIGARVKIKTYAGKQHIIIKGRIGLRKTLTAARYGINNTKVVQMGLGTSAAVNAVKQGGVLTIFLVTGFRVLDFVLKDKATLSSLIGPLATDIVKIGIASGSSLLALNLIGGSIATLAVGPLAAVIFVGVGVSILLTLADNHYGITERLIKALEYRNNNPKDRLPYDIPYSSTGLDSLAKSRPFTMGDAFLL